MENVKIKLSCGLIPVKGSAYAAAYDLYVPYDIVLHYGRQVVDLRFSMELPHGLAAIVQPRSGFSSKGMLVYKESRFSLLRWLGLGVKNARIDADVLIGLIDEDYRGGVGVIIQNRYRGLFHRAVIPAGTRIAQMRIVAVPEVVFTETEELDMTKDRRGGYGSTGIK